MRAKKPNLLIGLTGGFGTGKSTVARLFRGLGAQVIDADKLAHRALKRGQSTYNVICARFGRKSILGTRGEINRKKLARIVFENPGKRKVLESIVHPFVFRQIKRVTKKKRGILILEVPLLFETRFNEKMDANIVVRANEKSQIARLGKRSGTSRAEVKARNKAQMPIEKKAKLADFVIVNNGSLNETKKQVVQIWKQLLKLSS